MRHLLFSCIPAAAHVVVDHRRWIGWESRLVWGLAWWTLLDVELPAVCSVMARLSCKNMYWPCERQMVSAGAQVTHTAPIHHKLLAAQLSLPTEQTLNEVSTSWQLCVTKLLSPTHRGIVSRDKSKKSESYFHSSRPRHVPIPMALFFVLRHLLHCIALLAVLDVLHLLCCIAVLAKSCLQFCICHRVSLLHVCLVSLISVIMYFPGSGLLYKRELASHTYILRNCSGDQKVIPSETDLL